MVQGYKRLHTLSPTHTVHHRLVHTIHPPFSFVLIGNVPAPSLSLCCRFGTDTFVAALFINDSFVSSPTPRIPAGAYQLETVLTLVWLRELSPPSGAEPQFSRQVAAQPPLYSVVKLYKHGVHSIFFPILVIICSSLLFSEKTSQTYFPRHC